MTLDTRRCARVCARPADSESTGFRVGNQRTPSIQCTPEIFQKLCRSLVVRYQSLYPLSLAFLCFFPRYPSANTNITIYWLSSISGASQLSKQDVTVDWDRISRTCRFVARAHYSRSANQQLCRPDGADDPRHFSNA